MLSFFFLNLKSNTKTELSNYEGKENFNCVISGDFRMGAYFGNGIFLNILEWIAFNYIFFGLFLYTFILAQMTFIIQLYGKHYGAWIGIGSKDTGRDQFGDPVTNLYPNNCNIFTNGSNGIVNWNGEQFGQIRSEIFRTWEDEFNHKWTQWIYIGVEGFTGIKFTKFLELKTYIVGSANHVAMDKNVP